MYKHNYTFIHEERGLGKRTTRSIRAMQLESFKSESMIDNFSEKRSICCERATFYNGAIRPIHDEGLYNFIFKRGDIFNNFCILTSLLYNVCIAVIV
jgi:hypothetical protein